MIVMQLALAASLVVQGTAVDVVTTSEYITARDGTRLAVDVHLPASRAPGTRLPALLELTRYWRASEDPIRSARPYGAKPRTAHDRKGAEFQRAHGGERCNSKGR